MPDVLTTLEAELTHKAHCVDAMKAGTCPLYAKPVVAAPPRTVRKATRVKTPRTPVVAVSVPLRNQPAAGRDKDTRVLALVAEHHGLTATEIGARLSVSVPTVYSRLQRLVREDRLTVGQDKKYRRAVAGEATPASH